MAQVLFIYTLRSIRWKQKTEFFFEFQKKERLKKTF